MTSKISYFNIAKEDMHHRMWMLALSILGSVLSLPVLFLLINHAIMENMERYKDTLQATNYLIKCYTEFITAYAVIAQGMILMFGALIVAFFGYRYLYSRKMVDLYHSIPVKRTKLFLANYVNGLLIWLIPMLISMLLTLVLIFTNLASYDSTAAFGAIAQATGGITLRFIFAFLIIYHFALVCIMLCGNIFNAICSTVIGGTVVFALYALIACGYSEIFFYTYSYNHDEPLYNWSILSPIIDAILVLTNEGPSIFLVGSVISVIVCFFAAWFLYVKRPSELAEHGIDNIWVQRVLRIITSVLAGLAGASIFIGILGEEATAWHLFGAILVGVFTFGVLNCIFHMNFRSFLAHKLEMLGTVVLTCLIIFAFKGDWFGYDEYVPDKEDIEYASIYFYDYSDASGYWYHEDEYDTIDMTYTDVDVIYNMLTTMTDSSHQGEIEENYTGFDVEVTLKNGKTFSRWYRAKESDLEVIRPIIESAEYQASAYPFSSGVADYPDEISIYSNLHSSSDVIEDDEQIKQIVDAYRADFAEHSTMEDLGTGIRIGEINIRVTTDEYSRLIYNPVIWSDYARTIEVIKELFPGYVLSQEDVTLTSIDISHDFDKRMPDDILYSYFGIEGYEDYDTYYDRLMTAIEETAEQISVTVNGIPEKAYAYEAALYRLVITDPVELEKYADIFYLGDSQNSCFFYDQDDYVYAGDATTSTGHRVNCYVKAGEFPVELIEQLIATKEQQFLTNNTS